MSAQASTMHVFFGTAYVQSLPVPASSKPIVTSIPPAYDDDPVWDALFARSQDVLARLADEALAERRAGRTEILDLDAL